MYVRFGFFPQKKIYHTQGPVLGSINAYPVNSKTHFNDQKSKYWPINLKDILDQPKHLLASTSMNTKLAPSIQLSLHLNVNKIHMSSSDTYHIQVHTTPKYKYQDQ